MIRLLLCILFLALAGAGGVVSPLPAAAQSTQATAEIDFDRWARTAERVEALLADPATDITELEDARSELVDWRSQLLAGQTVNSGRIATAREQIDALGPPPAEGESEPADIAARRAELQDALAALQAPGIAAVEGHVRADGLVREIDARLRAQQTEALLELSPMPVNPVNWPAAVRRLTTTAGDLLSETVDNWNDPVLRAEFRANLPVVIGLLIVALLAIVQGRRWIENAAAEILDRKARRGLPIAAFLASLGQIVVPMIGVAALSRALLASGQAGPLGSAIIAALPVCALYLIVARWLGTQMFPKIAPETVGLFRLSDGEQARGRWLMTMLGLILSLTVLRDVLFPASGSDPAATAVLDYPLIVLGGIMLVLLGGLLRRHATAEGSTDYSDRLIGLIGRAAQVLGVAGPVLGAVGYVSAAQAMVFPAATSIGLVGLLLLIQRVVSEVTALFSRDGTRDTALFPVLFGFAITLLSLPAFALIWGARWTDILEVFTRLQEGVSIGETRISPGSFLWFILVFALGYTATRMLQGALRTSILPKTRMDTGARNAIVSGTGYVGIFLAAVMAITAAGIDLSSLAIVAGALSVGIGFGLQNIVSNFVSGIILLIERPVTEGDWIEAGGHMGVVKAISVRSTRIETFDRIEVIVPNADLVSGTVTNWTRGNLNGRIIVKVGVAYGTDTRKVEAILREVIEEQPLVMLSPPPAVLFMGFGADSLDFEIRAILSDVNFGLAVKSDVHHEVARRFAEQGIEIPFAQRDIWLRNPEALAASVPGTGAPPPDAAPEGQAGQKVAQDVPRPRPDRDIGLMEGDDE